MFKRPFELVERLRIPMGPRKKSKPNPEAADTKKTDQQAATTSKATEAPAPLASENQSVDVPVAPSLRDVGASQVSQSTPQLVGGGATGSPAVQKQVENRASWYGSWRGKPAKPVAEVAKDSVSGNAAASQSTVSLPQSPRAPPGERRTSAAVPPSPRRYMSGSMRKASKGDALPASMSNLSVVSDATKGVSEQPQPPAVDEAPKESIPEPPLPPDPPTTNAKNKDDASIKSNQNQNAGWFGWWSRPDGYIEKPASDDKKEADDKMSQDAQKKPLPESPVEERTQPKLDQTQVKQPAPAPPEVQQQQPGAALNVGTSRNSWFWLWSSQQNAQGSARPDTSNGPKAPPTTSTTKTDQAKDTPMPDAPPPNQPEQPVSEPEVNNAKPPRPLPPRKSTGWAFWSRDEPDNNDAGKTHKQVGEIAVEGTPSQNHPEAAQFNEAPEQEQAAKDSTKAKPKSVRGRATARESAKDSPKQASTPVKNTPTGSPDRKNPIEPKVAAVAGKSSKEQPKQAKDLPTDGREDKNILLPDFNSTYSLLQQPTLWSQIRRLFIADTNTLLTPHLHLTPTPPRIKKALAIGVHGFFPSPIYQRILGPPTGTSIRFSNCAASAIKTWGEAHNQPNISIEKIALEGEGLIAERVDTLWKLLLNWIEHIRDADFILVACHSQGVPVSVMLLQRLLQFGCIGKDVRVGVCAMAGISLGPFAEYKTRLFGTTGLELFEFAEPESRVSKAYRSALDETLTAGVRIVYVGSIDDQLVSLESSTFSPPSHPNIYRAVFIDGRLHTSDFLTRLIGFTLKLRNLGLPDHGLIRELSPALAGSLYTGEGHSSLHHYMPIYDLAVRHTLETVPDPISPPPSLPFTHPSTSADANKVLWGTLQGPPSVKDANPFFLPWAMRGILEEEAVRRMMGDEVEELLRLFEEWRPVSKGLRDVKFRLEAVRSKL